MERRRHALQHVLFPWIGAVIGAILWGWFRLSALLGISTLAFILISAALPLIITGGFHVDGFMDTMDALHSYQPRERKLEILRIPTLELFL